MDALFTYSLVGAVRLTLERAGEGSFVLCRALNPEDWLNLGWFQDFLECRTYRELPLIWEDGRPLHPTDSLQVMTEWPDGKALRVHRTGSVIICGDILFSAVLATRHDGLTKLSVVLGERAPGALTRLRREYDDYARRRSRAWPHIFEIGGDPLPRPTHLDWDDLVVPSSLRADLRRQVETFFSSADAFRRLRIPHRRGLLLTGPPGNGKTTAIRVIASRRPEPFYIFSLTDESERYQIDDAFDRAAYDAPSILCFEDIDSLFNQPGTLSQFLNRMDGLHPLEGVLVLATTNHPEKLDSAITQRPSRFDRIYVFGNPADAERRAYLSKAFQGCFDERLVEWTEGMSLAQLKEVYVSACLEAMEKEGCVTPELESARRAIDRLRGQKAEFERRWEEPNAIGFGSGRLKISMGPVAFGRTRNP
jgi:hypothetical protein